MTHNLRYYRVQLPSSQDLVKMATLLQTQFVQNTFIYTWPITAYAWPESFVLISQGTGITAQKYVTREGERGERGREWKRVHTIGTTTMIAKTAVAFGVAFGTWWWPFQTKPCGPLQRWWWQLQTRPWGPLQQIFNYRAMIQVYTVGTNIKWREWHATGRWNEILWACQYR